MQIISSHLFKFLVYCLAGCAFSTEFEILATGPNNPIPPSSSSFSPPRLFFSSLHTIPYHKKSWHIKLTCIFFKGIVTLYSVAKMEEIFHPWKWQAIQNNFGNLGIIVLNFSTTGITLKLRPVSLVNNSHSVIIACRPSLLGQKRNMSSAYTRNS